MSAKKNTKLRCYFVDAGDDDSGIAVVAFRSKDAKKFVWKSGELCDGEFTDLRTKWQKDANVDGLTEGYIIRDVIDGLRRRAYGYAEDYECPCCGREDYLSAPDGIVGCDCCLNPGEYLTSDLSRARDAPGDQSKACIQLFVCLNDMGERVFGCDLAVGEVPSPGIVEKCAKGLKCGLLEDLEKEHDRD